MQKICDDKQLNCKILDKFYEQRDYQNVLKVVVQFEDETIETFVWNNFKNRTNKNKKSSQKWTQEKAFNFCKEHGFYPLEEAIFKTVDNTFPCRDDNDFIYMISITNLKRHLKDNINFSLFKGNPYGVSNIVNYCKKYRPDFIFLDKEIKTVKDYYHFKYMGELKDNKINRYFTCTLDYFIHGNGECILKMMEKLVMKRKK